MGQLKHASRPAVLTRWAGRNAGAALVRAAYLLTGDHQLAEDLVQTALARAVLRWRSIQGDPEPYVRRILFTQRVSLARRRRVAESLVADPDARPGPSGSAAAPDEAADRRLLLRRALDRLTPRQRAVLVLRFYEDRTEAETAALLGLTGARSTWQTFPGASSISAAGPLLG